MSPPLVMSYNKVGVIVKFTHGNRCGFSLNQFRQPEALDPEVQNRIPKFIRQIQYSIRVGGIPGLKLRAERDEAVRALTIELLNLTDLWTGKIGIPTKDGWLAFGWKRVLRRLPWYSESRLWEALKVLQKHGLFGSNQRLADPRYITKDDRKKSGYAISDKGFTETFWTAFRQLKRWKHESDAKAKRTAEKAAKVGKTLQDFYKRTWCSTTKGSVKQLTAAGMTKTSISVPTGIGESVSRPSANAIKMQLTVKLANLGIKDAYDRASKLFDEFGAAVLINTEQFLS